MNTGRQRKTSAKEIVSGKDSIKCVNRVLLHMEVKLTDKTVGQAGKPTNKQTDRQDVRQACRQADIHTNWQIDRQTDRQTDRLTDRTNGEKEEDGWRIVSVIKERPVFKIPITPSENFLIEFLSFSVALQYPHNVLYNSCSLLRR
jgi:hypothetical protein